jgi:hypothetical protein
MRLNAPRETKGSLTSDVGIKILSDQTQETLQEHAGDGLQVILANVTDTKLPGEVGVTFTSEKGDCGVVGIDVEPDQVCV